MASAAAELLAEREPEPLSKMQDPNRTFVGAESLVRMALEQYTEILETASDPRVSDWPLMDSPIPTFLIVILYLYGVTLLGPRMMSNRKPYRLKNVLVAYNAFQVLFSLGMLYEVNDMISSINNFNALLLLSKTLYKSNLVKITLEDFLNLSISKIINVGKRQ